MIPFGFVILAASFAAALDELPFWNRGANGYHREHEPTAEEAERRLFESRLFERLSVREYGKFDMLKQHNRQFLRIGSARVPTRLQVMLHLANSPILHGSIFDSLNVADVVPEEVALIGVPIKLSQEGIAYNLIVTLLENNVPTLRQYEVFKKEKPNWSTYLDNGAAYTFLWRLVARQVQIERHHKPRDADDLRKQLLYCYRNESNEILRFKYRPSMNREKHHRLAGMLSQWSIDKLPVSDKYLDMLNKELAKVDRSSYPLEMFENLGDIYSYVRGDKDREAYLLSYLMEVPPLRPSLSMEESLDIEAHNIAKVTIRFADTLIAKMLERHGICAFRILKKRKELWRLHGISQDLHMIRSHFNELTMSSTPAQEPLDMVSSKELNEIEELLFESSKKFSPYWSMKNDILYRSSNLINLHEVRTMGLMFEPDRLITRMMNMRGDSIDFMEVYAVLHRLINMKTPKRDYLNLRKEPVCQVVTETLEMVEEQYRSLPTRIRSNLVAKCRCLLAFLYMFGVVDRHGKLDFPSGWPRDIGKSLTYISEGISASCGLCNSLLGFMSGIGYPPVVENMYAWETPRLHSESAVYQMLVTSGKSKGAKHTERYDKTLLSYVSGHYKEDEISSLALAYYLHSGMGHPSRILEDVNIRSGVERTPKDVGKNCIEALPFVINAAKSAVHSRVPTVSDDGAEEYRSKRYAEFIKKLAGMGDTDGLRVMGDFYYTGHESGNIRMDMSRALEYWTRAANQGDITSAMTVASHLINMINREHDTYDTVTRVDSEDINLDQGSISIDPEYRANLTLLAEGYLHIVAQSSNLLAAAKARFNMARYGIGQERDPVAAAMYLKDAADRGDVTSQMLMGHAYAGLLPDITPADGKNLFLALDYYRRASQSGNNIAAFNAAVLTLHGYDLKYHSSFDRCKASFGLFQYIARQALMPAAVRALAKRALQMGDEVGHVMMNLMLSEMGDPDAHAVAAKHFKNSGHLCYVKSDNKKATLTNDTKRQTLDMFSPYPLNVGTNGSSPCYLMYARRSGNDPSGGSKLLYAEALMATEPELSAKWVIDAKLQKEPKSHYVYAEMLESGLGVNQDCKAAYGYYNNMYDSKDFTTKVLGSICIQRARFLWLLQCCPNLYELFANTFYDPQIAALIVKEDYIPCWYPLPRFQVINEIGDIVNTYLFLALVAFATLVYLNIH